MVTAESSGSPFSNDLLCNYLECLSANTAFISPLAPDKIKMETMQLTYIARCFPGMCKCLVERNIFVVINSYNELSQISLIKLNISCLHSLLIVFLLFHLPSLPLKFSSIFHNLSLVNYSQIIQSQAISDLSLFTLLFAAQLHCFLELTLFYILSLSLSVN